MSAPWHLTAAELDAAYDALAARLTEAERQMSDARVLIAVGDYSSAAARLAPKAADSAPAGKHTATCSYWDGLMAQICNCGATPTVSAPLEVK